jgi:hypothetical protein
VTEDYQQPFVGIRKRLGCASEIGRTNRNQYLSLGQGCDSNNVIHHELMHAMGFQHEQNRPDRDDHVRIKFQNIDESSVFNFQMINHTAARSVYELISVMHYASNSFIKNGLTCTPQDTSGCGIVTKDNKYIPYAVVMTDLDVEIIKKGYNL